MIGNLASRCALALSLSCLLATGARADEAGPAGDAVGAIYKLQAAFHQAKTAQDLGLMMSLWADDATLTIQGDPRSPYVGSASIKGYWEKSGSFTHHRFSLVPSYKTQIEVSGDRAWLYFECHDVGDFAQPNRSIVVDTFLAGTVRRVGGRWVYSKMTAGQSAPLSLDHYYFTKEDAGFQK